jgi:hypothetical protein
MQTTSSATFGVVLTICSVGAVGCGGPETEAVTTVQAALTVGQDFCVLGNAGLLLGDRAVANGLTGAGRTLDVGSDARINGTTLVDGSGVLRDRARIVGDLTLSGTVTRGIGSVVTGTVRQNTPVTLPRLFSQSIPAGTDAVSIGPGANVTLRPGGYGDVVIRSRSVVRLTDTYDVTSFTVEPDVTLIQDPPGASININSVGPITFGDRDVLQASDPTNVLVYSNGATVSVGTQSTITGLIDAPAGGVAIRSRARLNGCAGAGRQLTIEPDATITSSNPNATLPLQPPL